MYIIIIINEDTAAPLTETKKKTVFVFHLSLFISQFVA